MYPASSPPNAAAVPLRRAGSLQERGEERGVRLGRRTTPRRNANTPSRSTGVFGSAISLRIFAGVELLRGLEDFRVRGAGELDERVGGDDRVGGVEVLEEEAELLRRGRSRRASAAAFRYSTTAAVAGTPYVGSSLPLATLAEDEVVRRRVADHRQVLRSDEHRLARRGPGRPSGRW